MLLIEKTFYLIIGCFIFWVYNTYFKGIVFGLRYISAIKKIQNKQKEEINKIKASKIEHDWVYVKSFHDNSTIKVCQKTGYIPSLERIIPVASIKAMQNMDKMEESYEAFKKEKMKEISDRRKIDQKELEDIIEETYNIKKDFYLNHMTKSLEEIQK